MVASVEDHFGRKTTNLEDTMKVIVQKLMPDDNPEGDTESNAEVRQNMGKYKGREEEDLMITEEDLHIAATNIKIGRAPGLDQVHRKMLALMIPYITDELLKIYNACSTLGYFPSKWKIGKLVTILKSPSRDPKDIKSLRPVTLTSELAKMLERITLNKVYNLIPQTRMYSDAQYGFRKKKSTVDAITRVLALAGGEAAHQIVIFVDIAGAFDNAWWPAILKLAHDYNLPASIVQLLKSYLSNRWVVYESQTVAIDKELTEGCPQGSVMGPMEPNCRATPEIKLE
ncbi:hypothetical protein JTB14_016121 [Gonioctena quinquepunctata]|nr:hypothetical protein JTB14_016121 [Gonioctena quinquepunctata]